MAPKQSRLESIFPGSSKMASRMRAFDWSANPLGPPQNWPQSLKTSVRIMLTSRQPMSVWWGPQLINLYNDGCAGFLQARHPSALGQPAPEVWPEIWPEAGPHAHDAMGRDEGACDEAIPLLITRNGDREEIRVTFSYSPIPDDRGGVGGILCALIEETQRIIGERQIALLRGLAATTADARNVPDACRGAVQALETDPADLPFALIYVLDTSKESASLLGVAGLPGTDNPASPSSVVLGAPCIWPLLDAFRNRRESVVSDLANTMTGLPVARAGHILKQAAILPIAPTGAGGKEAVLVAGLNPLRPFDDNYRGFLRLVACGISAALASVQAYEAELCPAEPLARRDPKTAESVLRESNKELERQAEERKQELLQSEHLLAAELERASRLQQISTQLVEAGNVGALYEQILDATTSFGADFASIQILDPERGVEGGLHLVGQRGFPEEAAAFWKHVKADSATPCGSTLRSRERAVIEDVETFEPLAGTRDLEVFRQTGIRSVQTMPLFTRSGLLLGAFSTHWRLPHVVTLAEARMLDVLARLIADLIERHQSERDLREKEERFRLFVENVREYAFLQTSAEGRITSWNPGAEHLFGYNIGEVLGTPVSALLTAEDRAAGAGGQQLTRARTGSRIRLSLWMIRKDGSKFWASCMIEPIMDSAGNLRGNAMVLRDETERRLAEEALRRSLADKEVLLKEVHHRVKNNLQVITSLFQLQADQIADPRALSVFDDACNRVAAISAIHELLYQSDSFADVDLAEYTRQLLPSLVRFYDLGGLVTATVAGGDVVVDLDRAVSYGLLLNELVSNTCKHAFPQNTKGRIHVTLAHNEKQIFIQVRDTGIGLPENFNYPDSSSLGGQLVSALARRLGADLNVCSGPGAVTELRFPVAATDEEDA